MAGPALTVTNGIISSASGWLQYLTGLPLVQKTNDCGCQNLPGEVRPTCLFQTPSINCLRCLIGYCVMSLTPILLPNGTITCDTGHWSDIWLGSHSTILDCVQQPQQVGGYVHVGTYQTSRMYSRPRSSIPKQTHKLIYLAGLHQMLILTFYAPRSLYDYEIQALTLKGTEICSLASEENIDSTYEEPVPCDWSIGPDRGIKFINNTHAQSFSWDYASSLRSCRTILMARINVVPWPSSRRDRLGNLLWRLERNRWDLPRCGGRKREHHPYYSSFT